MKWDIAVDLQDLARLSPRSGVPTSARLRKTSSSVSPPSFIITALVSVNIDGSVEM